MAPRPARSLLVRRRVHRDDRRAGFEPPRAEDSRRIRTRRIPALPAPGKSALLHRTRTGILSAPHSRSLPAGPLHRDFHHLLPRGRNFRRNRRNRGHALFARRDRQAPERHSRHSDRTRSFFRLDGLVRLRFMARTLAPCLDSHRRHCRTDLLRRRMAGAGDADCSAALPAPSPLAQRQAARLRIRDRLSADRAVHSALGRSTAEGGIRRSLPPRSRSPAGLERISDSDRPLPDRLHDPPFSVEPVRVGALLSRTHHARQESAAREIPAHPVHGTRRPALVYSGARRTRIHLSGSAVRCSACTELLDRSPALRCAVSGNHQGGGMVSARLFRGGPALSPLPRTAPYAAYRFPAVQLQDTAGLFPLRLALSGIRTSAFPAADSPPDAARNSRLAELRSSDDRRPPAQLERDHSFQNRPFTFRTRIRPPRRAGEGNGGAGPHL